MPRRDIKQEAEDAVAAGIVDSVWEYIHGTTHLNNLPDHKKHLHEGHCWTPCPYSAQADNARREVMLGTATPAEGINDHNVSGDQTYYMKTHNKGTAWGFECTFDNCPYYTTHGKRYFYI